ncbi:TPA: 50S ribosomal protein L31e [Candidatus Bathyarchaeota archaeon]|nr:50S ribosomal protein L31e [Candidatus Bathyarchaeota archaeon]
MSKTVPDNQEETSIKEQKGEESEEEEDLEEIVEERVYTVPLRDAWRTPRQRRAPRAVRILKSFIQRHMKPESIVISNEVNEHIWRRGIQKPPRKVRVRALKDRDGKVLVRLAEGD